MKLMIFSTLLSDFSLPVDIMAHHSLADSQYSTIATSRQK